jgi:threonylcarbamoyladenosine tRNA methylthiotransferase MtaB
MRIAFHTFGCKLNQYETESIADAFHTPSFSLVSETQEADLYIVNTCAVTSKSEQKARVLVRRLSRSHPNAFIITTGCYAQLKGATLDALSGNTVVIPQEQKDSIHDLAGILSKHEVQKRLKEDGGRVMLKGFIEQLAGGRNDPFRYNVNHYTFHSRAFLKVQDGCNYRCSYCLIPHARGPSISLDLQKAVERAKSLEAAGYNEIVLTGVNITSYRSDGAGLAALIETLLQSTERARIRLSSLEPEMIGKELQRAIVNKRICQHFHIPVQSGSNRILGLMRRRYTHERVLESIEILRSVKPDAFIAGDFIAGFPGEEEEDFQATVRLIEEQRFARLHVFPFSPRPETEAYVMRSQLNDRVKKERVRELLALSDRLLEDYTKGWKGRALQAIVEGAVTDEGQSKGLTGNYLKLLIHGLPVPEARAGMLVSCRIETPGNPSRARFLRFVA